MTAGQVLLKMAKCQKDLHRLAQQMLKDDKADGVRWTNHMDKHGDLLMAMVDDARLHSDLTDEEENAINKAAE